MEALISQIPKSLKAPRNSRSKPAMPRELCPEGSDQLSPSLMPLDRVPAGVCQESHQTIVPSKSPALQDCFPAWNSIPQDSRGQTGHCPPCRLTHSTTSCCSSQRKLHWEELGAGQKSSGSAQSAFIWFELLFNIMFTLRPCLPSELFI